MFVNQLSILWESQFDDLCGLRQTALHERYKDKYEGLIARSRVVFRRVTSTTLNVLYDKRVKNSEKLYCLLKMFRAPLCPSSGAQEYYTVVAACGISCCRFQVAGLVWS